MNVQPLGCTPETNITLHANYAVIKEKETRGPCCTLRCVWEASYGL